MEEFKIGQLTKELVAIKLQQMEDPCAVAADLMRKTAAVALKAMPVTDPTRGKVIEDAVYGGMQGVLLSGEDMARGGVVALSAVVELAQECEVEPGEAFKSALRGLARLRHLLTETQLHELQEAVEKNFNGAGEVFAAVLAEKPYRPDRALKSA